MTQLMNAHTYGIQFRNLSVSWPPFSVSSYQTFHCDHLLTDLGCGAIIRKKTARSSYQPLARSRYN